MQKVLRASAWMLLVLALTVLCGCGRTEDASTQNDTSVQTAPEPAADKADAGKIIISEIMVKNRAATADSDGDFSDWIELENLSGESVSLAGWSVSDGENKPGWHFPELTLAAGERLIVFASGKDRSSGELHTDFSLSADETVCLFTPSGALSCSLLCPDSSADVSYALGSDGEYQETQYPTPGYENSDEGYSQFCEASLRSGPLVINEVMVSNLSYAEQPAKSCSDWVELKNISSQNVQLSDYWLSDNDDDFLLQRLPDRVLAPGETVIIYCSGEEDLSTEEYFNTCFTLGPNRAQLYLCTSEKVVDYVNLHDIPVNGSCGRIDGENGMFYFTTPSPGTDNAGGVRMVSEKPAALTADGVYNNTEGVTVELSAGGSIRYTTDGSVPNENSAEYTEPFTVDQTTVVRAVAFEDGKAPSRVLTLSYIVNENHTLPVLSLAVDDAEAFSAMYDSGNKNMEVPASLSLYEEGKTFTNACGVKMSGSGSLELPKKSMSVMFRGRYGDGNLDCDVFDSGISTYDSLTLRVGEAYPTTIIQSDLFQDLCLEMNGSALTQHSKFCILYVNGEYYGIYCLKEKFSEQYYASIKGVDKDSVTILKYPVAPNSTFGIEVLDLCSSLDLSVEENYRKFCDVVDVDSLIDWFLVEGLSGNQDIGGNLRLFRSTENGGRWSFALYDLDWGFTTSSAIFYNTTSGTYYHSGQCSTIMNAAFQNAEFRDKLLSRYAELYDTVLSTENILAKLDAYEELLAPEIVRERAKWGNSEEIWRLRMDQLRSLIIAYDLEHQGVTNLCGIMGVSAETRMAYFGW